MQLPVYFHILPLAVGKTLYECLQIHNLTDLIELIQVANLTNLFNSTDLKMTFFAPFINSFSVESNETAIEFIGGHLIAGDLKSDSLTHNRKLLSANEDPLYVSVVDYYYYGAPYTHTSYYYGPDPSPYHNNYNHYSPYQYILIKSVSSQEYYSSLFAIFIRIISLSL